MNQEKYTLICNDADSDPVIVDMTIRGIATFQIAIPKDRYDGMAILDLADKHGGAA